MRKARGPMVRRILLVTSLLALAVAAWLVYVFGVAFGLWQPLTRPRSVSASARYVSSIEDGTWFDCSVDSKRNVDFCKAWDFEGHLIADGDFRLEGQDRAATNAELRPSFVISSGGHAYMIYLYGKAGSQSAVLVPVDARHPHSAGCKWVSTTNTLACN